jgi:hypothetical protein
MFDRTAVFAREREEETWAQLAAKIPPKEHLTPGGTIATSRSLGLRVKNQLRGTSRAPQSAARSLAQKAAPPAKSVGKSESGDRKTLSTPTNTRAALDIHQLIPGLSLL